MERTIQRPPVRVIFLAAAALFALFLVLPMGSILWQSLAGDGTVGLAFYADVLARQGFGTAFCNSVLLSAASGLLTTALAFLLAYTVNYTRLPGWAGRLIRALAVLPMLLPTITYGFAIIYSFGRQGLITMLLGGRQFFDIYGPAGLLMGYTIYTLPVSFLLIDNTMGYIDKKFMIVSRAMGDSRWRSFRTTVLTPLFGTFAASFIQSFTLCFTDYGIPTSVGGNTPLMATLLYGEMLGSLPNFHTGSAVAIAMLLPSVAGILLLAWLERYNVRYNKISRVELDKNPVRDGVCAALSAVVLLAVLSVFLVIFIVPFVDQWPYRLQPSAAHAAAVFADPALMQVYRNSLLVAVLTAVLGTLVVYGAALVSARGAAGRPEGRVLDAIALVTSTIPGMVLGVTYLLTFKGTPLQNSFPLIILCNVVHFFSSPYLMMKNGLEKLSASWETTARLMGDSWLKTVVRIITPNAFSTLLEVFGYYFTNAMVTVSAVIFIAGAHTMVITAKIKELQHFANFNEIFVLSILILATNLAAKGLFRLFSHRLTQIERD